MWPFRKHQDSKQEAAKAFTDALPEAIDLVSTRWQTFLKVAPMAGPNALADQVTTFCDPMINGLRRHFPQLHRSPDQAIFLMVVMGILRSKSHKNNELEQAFASLGPSQLALLRKLIHER